jgi:hypothetical protein
MQFTLAFSREVCPTVAELTPQIVLNVWQILALIGIAAKQKPNQSAHLYSPFCCHGKPFGKTPITVHQLFYPWAVSVCTK